MLIYFFILFILWTCFGSFSTVLISRWHSGKWGIMMGRSECPHCNHTLSAIELIPLISWISQFWRCKNCKTPIPYFYPLAELLMWVMFVWSGYISYSFWYTYLDVMWWIFLLLAFTTGVYILYDIRYMEIPDQIVVPTILLILFVLFIGLYDETYSIFFDRTYYPTFHTFLSDHIFAAILLYSFFFLQILIPGTIHLIRTKNANKILELLLSYFFLPFIIIYDFFRTKKHQGEENEIEIPAWIGGWDLRIAILIGLTLWSIHSIAAVIFAYIMGSIVGIWLLIHGRILDKKINHEIAFWPFLWIGWILALTFYSEILNYIQSIYQ